MLVAGRRSAYPIAMTDDGGSGVIEVDERRTRKRAADRIDELLDAADAQLNTTRSAMISMRAVGDAAGASRALVYAYFPDQFRLLDAVLERHLEWLRAAGIDRAVATGSLRERCLAAADTYLAHIAAHGMALEVALREVAVARQLSGAASAFRARLYHRVASLVARELHMGPNEALTLVQLLIVIPGDAGRLVHEGSLTLDEGRELTSRLVSSSLEALIPMR